MVARYAGDELARRTGPGPDGPRLFIERAQPPGPPPRHLPHRIVRADGSIATLAPLPVHPRPAIALAPPLAGGPWVAVHAPEWVRGHRRVIRAGGAIPGRFAIDFVAVGPDGRVTRGDPDRPADALGYGAPVLAGADAVVAAVRRDVAESASIRDRPANRLEDAAGNYVSLRLPDGHHAIYEHLKPGSVRVRAGQRVRVGDVLGALGFTGDSTGPHLHLHVAAGANPIRSEGVPFTLAYQEVGRYRDIAALGRARWVDRAPRLRRDWPPPNVVLRFPGG